jgi:DNA-binding NtrC family response regulator
LNRPSPTSAAATEPETPDPAGIAPGCVLLIEDDASVAESSIALLQHLGWTVVHADSAEQALERLDAGEVVPDVVLADIAMPGEFDGMELAVHLRSTRPGLRVVLMTGLVTEVHRAARDGFELLPKPCSPELLARTLSGRR